METLTENRIPSLLNSENRRARSLANLRPFAKGVSGNPAGRPKNAGRTIIEHLKDMAEITQGEIESIVADERNPAAMLIAARLWLQAVVGEGDAIDVIFDRTLGEPVQMNVNQNHGEPVRQFCRVIRLPPDPATD
jgi:hypothetical protein